MSFASWPYLTPWFYYTYLSTAAPNLWAHIFKCHPLPISPPSLLLYAIFTRFVASQNRPRGRGGGGGGQQRHVVVDWVVGKAFYSCHTYTFHFVLELPQWVEFYSLTSIHPGSHPFDRYEDLFVCGSWKMRKFCLCMFILCAPLDGPFVSVLTESSSPLVSLVNIVPRGAFRWWRWKNTEFHTHDDDSSVTRAKEWKQHHSGAAEEIESVLVLHINLDFSSSSSPKILLFLWEHVLCPLESHCEAEWWR